jgi:hypothetical protein
MVSMVGVDITAHRRRTSINLEARRKVTMVVALLHLNMEDKISMALRRHSTSTVVRRRVLRMVSRRRSSSMVGKISTDLLLLPWVSSMVASSMVVPRRNKVAISMEVRRLSRVAINTVVHHLSKVVMANHLSLAGEVTREIIEATVCQSSTRHCL